MRLRPVYSRALRLAIVILAVLTGLIVIVALGREGNAVPLAGYVLTTPTRAVPSRRITPEEAAAGTTVPPDTHVTFTLPDMPSITRMTLFGGPATNAERYWGYCFVGDERERKKAGMKPYHPTGFFYSSGQQREDASLKSLHEIFRAGETCYVMTSVPLGIGPDEDGDGLNRSLERLNGTYPNYHDSDGDGFTDGQEVFTTKTNPTTVDTDSDGIIDSREDKNGNGIADAGETSPFTADSDKDRLCDGDGWLGTACPERHYMSATKACPPSMPAAECRFVTLIHGEDLNNNGVVDNGETDPTKVATYGITDWQYRRQLLKASGDIRTP